MRNWYVVYTQANSELKALNNLMRQGFHAYLPQFKKTRRHARKTDTVLRPLFPRYLFVSLDLAQDRWRSILSTYGVNNLVGNRNGPEVVPTSLVETLQSRRDDGGAIHPLRLRGYEQGDPLKVEDGVFAGNIAELAELDDDERVTVLMSLLGREVRVQLPLEAVSAI